MSIAAGSWTFDVRMDSVPDQGTVTVGLYTASGDVTEERTDTVRT